MSLTEAIYTKLLQSLKSRASNNPQTLNDGLRLLSKWRSLLIQNTLVQNNGTSIMDGPFKGLKFLSKSHEGCYVPKLLGTYEQPLHETIETIISTPYEVILNIGSAEGYYAAGFAKRMPDTTIMAFDLNNAKKTFWHSSKREQYKELYLETKFLPEDFSKFENRKTLVFCDIEGAEIELLHPDIATSLKQMDLVVEAHDCFDKTISRTLLKRFSETHFIKNYKDKGERTLSASPEWFSNLSHLDQILSLGMAFWTNTMDDNESKELTTIVLPLNLYRIKTEHPQILRPCLRKLSRLFLFFSQTTFQLLEKFFDNPRMISRLCTPKNSPDEKCPLYSISDKQFALKLQLF